MTKTELIKDIERNVGAGVITMTELARYLGYKDPKIVKRRYLLGLQPITGKKYSVIDVAEEILRGGA